MHQASGHSPEPILVVEDAYHAYGAVVALDHVTMHAKAGEFLTILGESGSGKTTLLKLISGLETPTSVASLRLGGMDVTGVPAYARNCTTVFQNYALFPHMTVGANVEYGLKVKGVAAQERRGRALEALRLVRLDDKYGRQIHQLSGGERQRVALARSLVPEPAVLLLDEPLGALDEKLRGDMQLELMEIHRRLGMTFINITHSQEEALTMSDRIILMRKGTIVQEGSPEEIFDRPASRFAAAFMGVENLMEGVVTSCDGDRVMVAVGDATVGGRLTGQRAVAPGSKVQVGIRAERIHIGEPPADVEAITIMPGRNADAVYKGKYLDQDMSTAIGQLKVRLWDPSAKTGTGSIWWRQSDCIVMTE